MATGTGCLVFASVFVFFLLVLNGAVGLLKRSIWMRDDKSLKDLSGPILSIALVVASVLGAISFLTALVHYW